MKIKSYVAASLVAALSLLGAASATAQTTATGEPKVFSGTVEIQSTQLAFIISGKAGGGKLMFEGGEYYFNLGGLGVGGIGVQTIDAVGAVYNLDDLSKFPGTYIEARAGATAGTASTGIMTLSNQHGVILDLKVSGTGLALSLGADGVIISMK